jgi:hypothetical protein
MVTSSQIQGIKKDPFAKTNCVENPDNWQLRYDRIILKEVRKISHMALIDSVSTVGGGLQYDAAPVQSKPDEKVRFFTVRFSLFKWHDYLLTIVCLVEVI